jgi:hypothetical protein
MSSRVVPWHRQLFAGSLVLRPGFYLRLFCMSFMVDRVYWILVFVCIVRFSPVSNISLMLCTHLYIYVALARRTSRQSLGNFKQSNAVWDVREHWIETYFHIVTLQLVKLLQNYKQAMRQCLWSRYSGTAVSTVESRLWSVGIDRTVTYVRIRVQCTMYVWFPALIKYQQ